MNRWPCYSSALLLFFSHCQGARYRVIPADEKITKNPRGQLPKHSQWVRKFPHFPEGTSTSPEHRDQMERKE